MPASSKYAGKPNSSSKTRRHSQSAEAAPTGNVKLSSEVNEECIPQTIGAVPVPSAETNVTIGGFNERPKDEIAMLRNGYIDRSAQRSSYGQFGSEQRCCGTVAPRLYDEIELSNRGLHEAGVGSRPVGEPISNKEHSHHYYSEHGVMQSFPGTDPITTAELNSRGLIDEKGHVHYSLESLANAALKQYKRSRRRHKEQESPSARSGSRSSSSSVKNVVGQLRKPTSEQAVDSIACVVGKGDDRAKVTYTITRDGRTYDLDDPKSKRCIHLSYNKKTALLLSLHD